MICKTLWHFVLLVDKPRHYFSFLAFAGRHHSPTPPAFFANDLMERLTGAYVWSYLSRGTFVGDITSKDDCELSEQQIFRM